jgi:tRNA (mo5U34)-methyltransferase
MTDTQNLEHIKKLIASIPHWYHQIELAPGLVTPGAHRSKNVLDSLNSLGLPLNCAGMRVLDLGARDGFFSFEMEKRQADVLAVDYTLPTVTGFSVVANILNSRVPYKVDNIYALSAEKYGKFDIVLCLGLIYHLRNPMLALDIIRSLCKPDALLFVESAIMTDLFYRLSDVLHRLMQIGLGRRIIPDNTMWRFLPLGTLNNDGTNCWLPSLEGLKSALEAAEFRVLSSLKLGDRSIIAARVTSDSQIARFRHLDTSVGEFGTD